MSRNSNFYYFCSAIFFIGCTAFSRTVFAESAEEVTVTANHTSTPLSEVGSAVTVLTAEDIQRRNTPQLSELLRGLTGVSITNAAGFGKDTAVRIRGEEAYRTTLIIDGINIADTTATQIAPRFEGVTTNQCQRIEVLRGAQGMMYGADAGGVISLFSKTAQKSFEGDAQLESGKFDTSLISGNLRGKNNSVNYSLGANFVDTQGINARKDDPSRDADGYNSQALHGVVRKQIDDTISAGLVYHFTDSDNAYDRCSYPSINNCANTQINRAGRADLRWESNDTRQEIAYSNNLVDNRHYAQALQNGPDGTPVPEKTFWVNQGDMSQWQYNGSSTLNPALILNYGANAKQEYFFDKTYSAEHKRKQVGIYSEVQFAPLKNLNSSLGARLDDNEDFGQHASYRLANAYLIPLANSKFIVKSALYTGYRAPSLYEIYYNHSANAGPGLPESLDVETSEGGEVGVQWQDDDSSVEITAFTSNIRNEIYFDLINYAGYLQANSRAQATGLEFTARTSPVAGLTLGANYTYTDADIPKATAQEKQINPARLRRPRNLYNLSAEYQGLGDKLRINTYFHAQTSALDVGQIKLAHYRVLDMNTAWQFTDAVQAYLRLTNAFDAHYEEIHNYETAPRAAYLGLRLSF